MAVVLKTTKVQAFGGSNPSPSANSEYESTNLVVHFLTSHSLQIDVLTATATATV